MQPSSSRTSLKILFVSGCFLFLFWERHNNGSTREEKLLTHGRNALRHSSPNSSLWVRLTPLEVKFPVFSTQLWNQFQKLGRGTKNILPPVLIMGWTNGLSSNASTMGSCLRQEATSMLLLEEPFSISQSRQLIDRPRRSFPTKDGMMNALKPRVEVRVCTPSRRRI